MSVQMHPVKSEGISAVGHDEKNGMIHVVFRSGGIHRFGPFTKGEFDALKNASSVGKHFHANIRARAVK